MNTVRYTALLWHTDAFATSIKSLIPTKQKFFISAQHKHLKTSHLHAPLQIPTPQITVFWVLMLCSLMDGHQHFKETYCYNTSLTLKMEAWDSPEMLVCT